MKVRQTPERFRNPIGRYIVLRDPGLCTQCGTCMRTCPVGVFSVSGRLALRPKDWLCPGPCSSGEFACLAGCPAGAITIRPNPLLNTLGDFRWPSDLILDTWEMARSGKAPAVDELRYNLGQSGGGFDRMRLQFPEKVGKKGRVTKNSVIIKEKLSNHNCNLYNRTLMTRILRIITNIELKYQRKSVKSVSSVFYKKRYGKLY